MRLASFFLTLTAVVAVPAAGRAQSTPTSDAIAAYEKEAVLVRHLVLPLRDGTTADEQGHVRYTGKWDAFVGIDHHPIDEAAFYRIVGRDDLLHRYQVKARIKTGLALAGGALMLGGAMVAMIAQLERSSGVQVTCVGCARSGPSPLWGLAIAGTGLVTLITSGFLTPSPIDADEADRLASDHDRELRSRLGLTDTAGRE
jgi:hypothetical protein